MTHSSPLNIKEISIMDRSYDKDGFQFDCTNVSLFLGLKYLY